MIVNSDITVFNKRYDRAERTERFYGTQIRGVSFYSRKGTSSGSKELSKSDAYTIRIPADADTSGKKYADQKAYSELDDTVFSGYWTLQPGAIIVQEGRLYGQPRKAELSRRNLAGIRTLHLRNHRTLQGLKNLLTVRY